MQQPEDYIIKLNMIFRLRQCNITEEEYNKNKYKFESLMPCLHPECKVRNKLVLDFTNTQQKLSTIKHKQNYYGNTRWGFVSQSPPQSGTLYIQQPQLNVLYKIINDKRYDYTDWFSVEVQAWYGVWGNTGYEYPVGTEWKKTNWQINKNGIIRWKQSKREFACHQSLNNVDFRLVRIEFNILVVYFALKLKVLAMRARKSIIARKGLALCLRACHYNHRESPFGWFAGTINHPIKTRIFAEYGLFPEVKGIKRLLECV